MYSNFFSRYYYRWPAYHGHISIFVYTSSRSNSVDSPEIGQTCPYNRAMFKIHCYSTMASGKIIPDKIKSLRLKNNVNFFFLYWLRILFNLGFHVVKIDVLLQIIGRNQSCTRNYTIRRHFV